MSTPSLQLWFFGACTADVNGRPWRPPRLRKSTRLLALLGLRPGREVPRIWLAETLWPDSTPTSALFNLRQTLANDLRPALGEASGLITAPTSTVLRLEASDVWTDVTAFDRAIADSSTLELAVTLYRGSLLEGWSESWAVSERAPREEAYQAALETLAAAALARWQPAAAAGYLRRCIAAVPLRESAYAALMESLAASGDYAAVTQVYRDLRLLLYRELNTAPSAEIETRYRSLQEQASRPTRPLPPPHVIAPRSERLSLGHLPIPLTDLIGREREITEVTDWMGKRRLVTLAGAGGVGKTRLAIAIGHTLIPRFPQGVWFVELAALQDSSLVARMVAQTLGIPEPSDRKITQALTEALAPCALLLILDTCEHVSDACAELAETLLNTCSELRILSTNHQTLGVTGEQVYRVPSLALPPVEQTEEQASRLLEKSVPALLEYASVQLFVERAIQANPGFRLDEQRAKAVTAICHRLDGIPLALEMAAAWVRLLPVEEIQHRLDDRFRLLTMASRTALGNGRLGRSWTGVTICFARRSGGCCSDYRCLSADGRWPRRNGSAPDPKKTRLALKAGRF